jgi:pimeloyl-ACP methyl ester carboxylesterase
VKFEYNETTYISFEKNGAGNQTLILFHGFGLTKKVFRPWITHLSERYTIYSIDLFYHGDSTRPHGRLHKKTWKHMFERFLEHVQCSRFSVLGFSLGARFAICSAIELSTRCDHLILVAPDAIYKTPWFRAATSFGLKYVAKYFLFHPKQMSILIQFAVKIGLVSSYIADFVDRELGNPDNRKRVYISWNHFKPLGYSKNALKNAFVNAPYKRTIVLGTKDIVIPIDMILPILDGCGFEIIELNKKHHQMITEEVALHLLS